MSSIDIAALEVVVRGGLDDPGAAVVEVERLSGGASRETWAVDVRTGSGDERALILQRLRSGAPGAGAGYAGMGAEAELLEVMAAAGVPVAPVRAGSSERSELGGAHLLTDRVEGETIPRRLLRDERWAVARTRLVAQAGEALAAIHRVDPAGPGVPALGDGDPLGQLRQIHDALGHPHPAFELAFRWLEAHRPPPVAPAVVHGDFRLGNLIVGPDGLRAVIDWELVHLGDPLEDLGWFCVRAWRFGETLPVAGLGTREELCQAYEAAGGRAVDPDVLHWWEVLGTLRWGVIGIMQAAGHLLGLSPSVELAAIGRRVCESEYDLLRLLGCPPPSPGWDVLDDHRGEASGPDDRPTAAELVEAVRDYLSADVLEATEGRVRFHGRVAVNVLGMVVRELAAGPARAAAHRDRLAALGVSDDAELASAIRDGHFDARSGTAPPAAPRAGPDVAPPEAPRAGPDVAPPAGPGTAPPAAPPAEGPDGQGGGPVGVRADVQAVVWASVLDKLAVANPSYAEPPEA